MAKSKRTIGGVSEKRASWTDLDDAPALGADFFARAQLNKTGKPAPGRPKSANRKVAVSLRLDPDVVGAYKAKGEGWQTLMNADLRKAVGLAAPKRRATGERTSQEIAKSAQRMKGRDEKKRE